MAYETFQIDKVYKLEKKVTKKRKKVTKKRRFLNFFRIFYILLIYFHIRKAHMNYTTPKKKVYKISVKKC